MLLYENDRNAQAVLAAMRPPAAKKGWETRDLPTETRELNRIIESGGEQLFVTRVKMFGQEHGKAEKPVPLIWTVAIAVYVDTERSQLVTTDPAKTYHVYRSSSQMYFSEEKRRVAAADKRMRALDTKVEREGVSFIFMADFTASLEKRDRIFLRDDVGIHWLHSLKPLSNDDIEYLIKTWLYSEGKIIGSVRDGGQRYK